jgi:hypothetical protein
MTSKERDRQSTPKPAEKQDIPKTDVHDLPKEDVARPDDVKGGSTVLEERWKR